MPTYDNAGGNVKLSTTEQADAYVLNRAAQVQGAGTAYSFTNSNSRIDFGTTDAEVTLPTAGTYFVSAVLHITNGASANDHYECQLYNATDAAAITGATQSVAMPAASGEGQIILRALVTVTAPKLIQIYGYNTTAARGTCDSAETHILYIRLY